MEVRSETPFSVEEAEDRSLADEEVPESAVFRIVGLQGDEVGFGWVSVMRMRLDRLG